MSLRAIVWVFDHSPAQKGARLVLLALAEYAHDDGSKAFPSVETIMRKTRLSERAVRDALKRLQKDKMVERTGATKAGVGVYKILGMCGGGQIPHPADSAPPGGQKTTEGGADSAPDPSTEPRTPEPVDVVIAAWRENAPPLIEHRDSFYEARTTRTAIERALRVYPPEAVAESIENHAFVLASPIHRWTYRWTLIEFLKRGIDRFVPEARPRDNFAVDPPGTGNGLSPSEIARLDLG